MKRIKKIIFILLLTISAPVFVAAQSMSISDRTPEQEAAKQTEKLQKELNLTADQTNKIYEINLRYARARQQSGRRSDAMERIKNKDNEIKRQLSPNQYNQLTSKRMEVQSVEVGEKVRYTRTNSQNRIENNRSRRQSSESEINTGRSSHQPNRTELMRGFTNERQPQNTINQNNRSNNQSNSVRSFDSENSSSRSSSRSSNPPAERSSGRTGRR